MIGKLMGWIRRKLDPPHYTAKLEEADKATLQKFMEVAQYKHELESMTGKRVEWPFVDRRKEPRDK